MTRDELIAEIQSRYTTEPQRADEFTLQELAEILGYSTSHTLRLLTAPGAAWPARTHRRRKLYRCPPPPANDANHPHSSAD